MRDQASAGSASHSQAASHKPPLRPPALVLLPDTQMHRLVSFLRRRRGRNGQARLIVRTLPCLALESVGIVSAGLIYRTFYVDQVV